MNQLPEIRPAILAQTQAEFVAQFNQLQPLQLTFHVDIMDGEFVPNQTWNDLPEISRLLKNNKFEVHLMTKNPIDVAEAWLGAGAIRAIVHREAISEQDFLDPRRHALALNPETKIEVAQNFLNYDLPLMLMAVTPGFSGQTFNPAVLEKIKFVKKLFPQVSISVDGGVKPELLHDLAAAGANILVMGSYLSKSPDPVAAYKNLTSYE